ncbi:hypothetical protein MRB53_016278 [Persea americana]|uniref:Uncharacterized protein n=1 Tax=Persea americana TaxID=3435 RepID=A0ACC2M2Q2_PERAE|nr:hypothetical protein MRB53_016278 [Persea americana]
MGISAVVCIVGWLSVYLSNDAWPLDIGRFFTGYGIVIYSYVLKFHFTNLRGGLTTINQLKICTGASTAFIIGTVLTWRTLALTGLYRNSYSRSKCLDTGFVSKKICAESLSESDY